MDNNSRIRRELPLVPLRSDVLLPLENRYVTVGRARSIRALKEAINTDLQVCLLTQVEEEIEFPQKEDFYEIGTLSRISQVFSDSTDTHKAVFVADKRVKVIEIIKGEDFDKAVVEVIEDEGKDEYNIFSAKGAAYAEILNKYYKELLNEKSVKPPYEYLKMLRDADSAVDMADFILGHIGLETIRKQEYLEVLPLEERLDEACKLLQQIREAIILERKIEERIERQFREENKRQYARARIKELQDELKGDDSLDKYRGNPETDDILDRMEEEDLPEYVKEAVFKEIERIKLAPPHPNDLAVALTYLELLLELPWNKKTEDNLDLVKAQELLENSHFGMEKVKERIVEHLAVALRTKKIKGPILCLVGPPGTGKTSVGQAIADAMDRKFIRMSLGGLHDESEIRGHRRTYIAAMPGKIIKALKQVKTRNPVILLDEIDKVGNDYRGDPSAAFLEVLDPEQNKTFVDNYVDLPFDLSDVMFVTTANNLEAIPHALRDRMEIIEMQGYTLEEKIEIAKKHLIKKEMDKTSLTMKEISFTDKALRIIIENYTRESGVRELSRQISSLCRKAVKKIEEGECASVKITRSNVAEFLGKSKYASDKASKKDEVGMITGLAWTAYGGVTLPIEVNILDGKGKLILTGQLGDVMQESAKAAVSYIRSRYEKYGIEKDFYEKKDIHIHLPEGAVPKDGPSAGLAMCIAIISALSGKKVRGDVALTGEVTIRGKVLPVGGIREKLLAGHRVGMKTLMIPVENEKDLIEVADIVKQESNIVLVNTVDEAVKHVLV